MGRKLLLKLIALLAVLAGMGWAAAYLLIDVEKEAQKILGEVERVTGREASVASARLKVFPVPALILTDFRVANVPQATADNLLTADRLSIRLDPMALLTEQSVRPGRVAMLHPILAYEIFADGTSNLDFLQAMPEDGPGLMRAALRIEQGSATISNRRLHRVWEIEDIGLRFALGAKSGIKGGFHIEGIPFTLDISMGGTAQNPQRFTLQGKARLAQEGGGYVTYEGSLSRENEAWSATGAIESEFADLLPWLRIYYAKPVVEGSEKPEPGLFDKVEGPIPASFSADVASAPGQITFEDLQLRAGDTEGRGKVIFAAGQWTAQLLFSTLDFSGLFTTGAGLSKQAVNDFLTGLVPPGLHAGIAIEAERFLVGPVKADKTIFAATLDDGVLIVNEATLRLAGETYWRWQGILSKNEQEEALFDGSTEIVGKKMPAFLNALGLSEAYFFTDHQEDFRAKAGLFLSQSHSVVSDFKVQAGAFYADGGANIGGEQAQDAEITLFFAGLKLDGLLRMLVPAAPQDTSQHDIVEEVHRRLDWLDAVSRRTLFRVVLQDYTLGAIGDGQAKLNMTMEPGRFAFDDILLALGDVRLEGSFAYDQREETPAIEGDLRINQFNLASLTEGSARVNPVARGNIKSVWPDQYFSFNMLKGYDSAITLHVDRVISPSLPLQNAIVKAKSTNGVWQISELEGVLWGGLLKASATLDVSSIPALSLSFAMQNIQSARLFEALAGHDNFKGTLDFSAQMTMFGISLQQWIKNMSGTFTLYGQDVVIKGFDIASLVAAVPGMRTVGDVVNTARVALVKNQSTFSVVEGGFTVTGGVAKIEEIKLRSKHAVGTLYGEANFDTWMMNLGTQFKLVSLSGKDHPVLDVYFRDSMDDPVIALNTRSLEAFIARKKLR